MNNLRHIMISLAALALGCMATAPAAPPSEAPAQVQAAGPGNAPPAPGAACVGWRQTGGCTAAGSREPDNDKACDVEIEAGSSGYCECAGGGRLNADCDHPQGTCVDACRTGGWKR